MILGSSFACGWTYFDVFDPKVNTDCWETGGKIEDDGTGLINIGPIMYRDRQTWVSVRDQSLDD